jgi:hypothetical protein
MNTEHTPGPWTLDTCWNGWMLLANGRDVTTEPFDCEYADARLIAAAPDLLATLQALHACHRGFSSSPDWGALDDEARAAAESAIAKATGEDTTA